MKTFIIISFFLGIVLLTAMIPKTILYMRWDGKPFKYGREIREDLSYTEASETIKNFDNTRNYARVGYIEVTITPRLFSSTKLKIDTLSLEYRSSKDY